MTLAITEEQFQSQVIELARYSGWKCAHFRGVRIQRKNGTVYYQTPVQADGAGFPDLVLLRPPRIIYAELKSDKGRASPEQDEWLRALAECSGNEVYLWRPRDLDEIENVLKRD